MNFQELVAEVVRNTNRPDLGFTTDGGDEQIPKAVLSATLSLHLVDFFWRDISTMDVVFDMSAYIQTLDVSVIPRFRSLVYFRKWDPAFNASQLNPATFPPTRNGAYSVNSSTSLKMLEVLDLGGLFDSYGTEKTDVCYAAGNTVFVKSSTILARGKLGYYSYPDLDISNNGARFTSWIAVNHPFAVIHKAEHIILLQTGDVDSARELVRPASNKDDGGLLTSQVALLLRSNIEAVGR